MNVGIGQRLRTTLFLALIIALLFVLTALVPGCPPAPQLMAPVESGGLL